jgi:SnoaL-like domain
MDEGILKGWVDAYGRTWRTGDPDAAVLLFAEGAAYQETPFAEPARGREAIRAYWSLVREHHEDVEFSYSILSVDPAIVHCRATYVNRRSGVPTTFDGIFLLEFDSENRCTSFREWWHAEPGPAFQV